ncbi:polysaccharide deacetylase family protein [Geobacter grbiciae]|nr:polysaccharide deacetylase family protein [Geobacter grbiciae]
MIGNRLKKHIRNAVYRTLHYSGLSAALVKTAAKPFGKNSCIILVYHRIVDDSSVYLDKGSVVHHHLSDFVDEIPYLKRTFQILSMDDIVDRISSGEGFDRPTIAITFDDGYLDNYTLAYPVLKAHEVPATIYLATSLIGTSGKTWTDQIEVALLATKKRSIVLPFLYEGKELAISTVEQKRDLSISVAKALKEIPDADRRGRLLEMFRALEVRADIIEDPDGRLMLNWDEVKEMAANGITFGSHSHTHPILSRVPLLDAQEDIKRSKQVLEERLGQPINHFAYPNGRVEDFSDELRDYCQKIGFSSVATVIYGTNGTESSPFCLKRVGAVSPLWMMSGELMRYFV